MKRILAAVWSLLVSGGLFLSADFGVLAQTGPPPLPPTPLAIWALDWTNWHNERHEPPLAFTNLNSVPSWMNSALSVDTNTTAFLDLPIYANGSTNLTFDTGSLVFWCQPNWTSATDGGTGPGAWAPLWQVGAYSTNDLYGCWSLAVSPDGNTLAFITQTNGAGEIHAQIPIDWDAGDLWPQNSVAPLMHKDLQQVRHSILDHFVLSGTSAPLFGFQGFAVANPCRCQS